MLHFGQLAVFHALAETGSVTRAAARAMVSQPAVSKQLRQLERSVGQQLFDRGPRGVTLTAAGRTLARYAAQIFALAEEAERTTRDANFTDGGRVAIGASPTVATYVLPATLLHMRRRFPGVEVRVETASPRRLAVAIDDGELDLAVSSVPLPARRAAARAIGRERLVMIAPADRRGAPRLTAIAAAALPFVAYEAGDPTHALIESAFAGRGVAPNVTLALGNTEAIKRAVIAGLGVAIVPAVAVADELERGSLRAVSVDGLSIERPVWAVAAAGRRESKAATAFVCLLKHALRGTLPALPGDRPNRGFARKSSSHRRRRSLA